MRTNKNKSKIILAIAVALLATMISYSAFSNMHNQLTEQQKMIDLMQKTKAGAPTNETYAYAVSTIDLKAGEIVADTDVDFKEFGIKDEKAFDNRSDIVNKVLLKDIKAGEVFTTANIAKISNDDVTLRDGFRALTLPADNFQGKSETMKPGSFVDIYSSDSENGWVMEDVRIISLESANKSTGKSTTPSIMDASSITFEVSADEISDFISNVSKSKLVLVARSANEQKTPHKTKSFKKKRNYSAGGSNYVPSSLPNLPASVPISNYSGGGSGYSSLPQPIQPAVQQQSAVEVIEANVKSKVTFD